MAGSDQPDAAVVARRWERAEVERASLLRLARRSGLAQADADDCVQEAILSVVLRPDIDDTRIGGLLATAVKRRSIDLYRRRESAARVSRRLRFVDRDEAEAVDVALCDRAEAEWSAKLVHRLPPFQRQVLVARAEGRSWKDIARDFSTSVDAVESAVARARAAMRVAIGSTIGVVFAIGRRLRQPAGALAGGTATVVLVVATSTVLHPPASDGARQGSSPDRRPSYVLQAAASSSGGTGTSAASRHTEHGARSRPGANAVIGSHTGGGAPPTTVVAFTTPLYDGEVTRTEEDDPVKAITDCVANGYSLTITPSDDPAAVPTVDGRCNTPTSR